MRALIPTGDVFVAVGVKATLANFICNATDLGQNALQMARAYDYDIILLDLTVPTSKATKCCGNCAPRAFLRRS